MAIVVVRVRGLTSGTLNHIDALSDDIWVEWPEVGDVDSCPQIVGTFDEVDDGVVVLKWKQDDGAKGWVGIPLDRVEAVITVKGGFETQEDEDEEEDEDIEEAESEEDDEEEDEEEEETEETEAEEDEAEPTGGETAVW